MTVHGHHHGYRHGRTQRRYHNGPVCRISRRNLGPTRQKLARLTAKVALINPLGGGWALPQPRKHLRVIA